MRVVASKAHPGELGPEPTASPPGRGESGACPDFHWGTAPPSTAFHTAGEAPGAERCPRVASWFRAQLWIRTTCVQILAPLTRAV